jgi:predicted dehydrogenase
MSSTTPSRRGFLGAGLGAAAAASFSIVPSRVLGADAPSNGLTHAIIGVGGMGTGHISYVAKPDRLVAVADTDENHMLNAVKIAGAGCKGYRNFLEMLDKEQIDVCHIATPPHWHALASIYAAEAGCDIWCEKPMTHHLGEGAHVIEAVQRHGRMFRLNTWFRLNSQFYGLGCEVKPIKKIVQAGLLGWPLTVRVSDHTGFNWKVKMWSGRTDLTPQPIPPTFDYDLWLGPAPFKPYNLHRTHQTFRGYWDYDAGGLGDMGQHYLDPVQYILGKDGESPVEVEAKAPWPVHPDAVGFWWNVEMRYADGCRIIMESDVVANPETKGQPYIEGPKGKIFMGPRFDPPELKDAIAALPDPEPMISDFRQSVLTRRKFGLNEVNGNRSVALIHLADAAIRTGRKLTFDSAAMRFVGDDDANRLIDQPYRAPWHF